MGIEPANCYQKRIKDIFSRKVENDMEYIFQVVELMLYKDMDSTDMFEIYQLLGMENFVKLVTLVDGRAIRLPKKQDIEDALLASLLYYEREINKKEWKDIKKMYPELEISSLKNSLMIKSLNEFLQQKIGELLRKGNDE